MNNREVRRVVETITATDLALLQHIAAEYGVALVPDFDDMQDDLVRHILTLPATDPAPAQVPVLIAAAAGTPPGAPAPAPGAPVPPAPAPADSLVYTNQRVLDAVGMMNPATDLAHLQDIANAYNQPAVGNPYALRGNIEAHIHGLTLTDWAPAGVDAPMQAWAAAHPAPAPAARGWWSRFTNQLHTNNRRTAALVAGVALVGLFAAIWFFNRGGDTASANGDVDPTPTTAVEATATPTMEPTATPTPGTEEDDIHDDREELIDDVESARSKADEDLRDKFDDLIDEIEDAKTADELEELRAEFETLVREDDDEKDDDDDAEKPEPIDTAVTDKPEPTYTGTHRQPEKDFNVKCDKTFMDDTRWLLCEPGALQTEVGSFRWPEAEGVTYRSNCPEGFMWYGSMGQGKITTDSSTLVMQPENGLNYLVVIRCPLNDAIVDSDRNLTLKISDIVVGHAGWTPVDVLGGVKNPEDAAYVSMEWFGEQLVVSGTKSGTNCGATGCSRTIVVLHDVDSGLHERYLVTNVKGESSDADNDGIEDYASATWEKIYTNAR